MTLGEMIDIAQKYSKSGKARLIHTAYCCTSCKLRGIRGDFVEAGVWQGGNVMMARWARPDMNCWLYDTFDGMTEPGANDGARARVSYRKKEDLGVKWAAASVAEVKDNLIRENLYDARFFNFIVGDVRKTLRVEANLPERIAVLRLDTDWYDSTRAELEVLYPRLVRGGILIVDDYGHWEGARKAVDDFLGVKRRHINPVDYTAVWMVKP